MVSDNEQSYVTSEPAAMLGQVAKFGGAHAFAQGLLGAIRNI